MKNSVNTEMIKSYMKDNNISKTQFCKTCKISIGTLNKILSGDMNFAINALWKISHVLGIRMCQLFI